MSQTAPSIRVRDVALPTEHGGWSFTLEPAILGLIVAPSVAGFALAVAALVAFVARTPAKLALVDRRRGRKLPRTRLAGRIAVAELGLLVVLVLVAAVTARAPFWGPLAGAAPLLAVEGWFDMRSKSRRLVPELGGTVGVAAIAAAIALAGEASPGTAYGLWLIAAARAVGAVTFVRVQLRRKKQQPNRRWSSDLGQAIGAAGVAIGAATGIVSVPGALVIAVLGVVHAVLVRMTPPPAPVLGAQQIVLGLTVVLVAGLGAIAP